MKPIPALCQKTVTELCALLDGGQITSVEIVQAYLRAIDARDGEVHAYLETYPADALREAALRGGNAEVVDKLHEIVETYTPDESARQAG